jgi:hypothetical protein
MNEVNLNSYECGYVWFTQIFDPELPFSIWADAAGSSKHGISLEISRFGIHDGMIPGERFVLINR